MRRRLLVVFVALGAVFIIYGNLLPERIGFDVKRLIGEWEGRGTFVMPITGLSLSVKGKASFHHHSATGLVRTSVKGKKLFFTYCDSGYLRIDETTDSVSWELWDSWGKNVKYRGRVRDGTLKADRLDEKGTYCISVEFPHEDTLYFRLTLTKKDGKARNKARFRLSRVKN